jgi:hypothetical protein
MPLLALLASAIATCNKRAELGRDLVWPGPKQERAGTRRLTSRVGPKKVGPFSALKLTAVTNCNSSAFVHVYSIYRHTSDYQAYSRYFC